MSNENSAAISTHEFAAKPVNNLIIKYAGITLIGMLAQAIMVIFEGIIIGNGCGADGLTCVGFVMPLENLQLAIGSGFGIGLSTIAAIKMGEGHEDKARKIFATGSLFITLFMLILGLCLIIFAAPIARFLGTPDEYMDLMVPFIRIFGVGYPFCGYGQTIVFFFRMDEKPGLSTAAMTITAVLGVVWLYLNCFIFKFGIVGCGWYYAFSIGGWAFFGIPFFVDKKSKFKYRLSEMKIDWKVNIEAVKVALPYFCVQASVSIFTIIINNILVRVGTDLHVAAYAVISGYIIYILNMFTTSVSTGTTPIISYNLGEKLYDRLGGLMTSSMAVNAISVIIVTIIFEIAASPICWLFCGEADLVAVTLPAVRIVIIAAGLGSCLTILSGYFEAVYRLVLAVFTGIGRYLIIATICMLIMVFVIGMGVNGVWFGLLAADIIAFIVAVILAISEKKRLNSLIK